MSIEHPPMDVLMICDLGPTLGIGHAMRCLALGEELARRGLRVGFVADIASVPFVESRLGAHGFASVAPPDDVLGYVRLFDRHDPAAVVIDSYVLPTELYGAAVETCRTLAIVDGDPGDRAAHLYVDQNLGAEDDQWSLPERAQRLAGLPYALLRDDVLAARPGAPRDGQGADPLRVLAVLGGTDSHGAGPVVARALAATGRPFHLTLVAGNEGAREEAASTTLAPGQQLEIVAPTDRLPELVLAADLVVSAAGTSSWELLCLGAACAMVCVAGNQVVSYERMVETGVVAGVGRLEEIRADEARAVATLDRALGDPVLRRRLSARGWQMVDGHGRTRVADALLETTPLV